jgi:serine/threonine protein kinase
MSNPNWVRVQELYHAALEQREDDRLAFLQRECSNEDVRREVESLLAYEGHSQGILDEPFQPARDWTPALAVGRLVGAYEIIGHLGIGGMGEVYRARDRKLGREVAIKVLPEAFAQDPDRMARFSREAQVLASLNHPNIAAIYGIEESDNIRALVMELVDGPSLADRLARDAIPVDECLPLAKQIAEALEYAHERGVVHRDLKPANVKMTREGVVKVLDFGLAKAVEQRTAELESGNSRTLVHETLNGVVLGTAAYMAPEQARGKTVDRRADIWAFGAVLYEMLSGRPLFSGETLPDTLAQVMTKETDWEELPKNTPVRITRLLKRCLQKDPKTRLQAIGEARIAIDSADPEPSGTELSVSKKYLPWTAAALLAMSSAVLAIGLWRAARPVARDAIRLNVDLGATAVLPINRVGGLLAISPDGTRIAVIVRGSDENQRLAVRRLDQRQVMPLAGTEGATSPFFSPDGQSIAFFAGNKLKTIPSSGGAAVSLCDALDPRGGTWGDDGSIVLALSDGGLVRIPASGGALTPLTQLNREKHEVTHRWPHAMPGGKAILFTAHTHHGNYDEADIEVLALPSGERKTLRHGGFQPRYLSSGYLVYVQQTTLLAAPFDADQLVTTGESVAVVDDVTSSSLGASFDISRTGNLVYFSSPATQSGSSLFWLDSSGPPHSLYPSPGVYTDPQFSPEGKYLAVTASNGHGSDIWIRDLESGSMHRRSFLAGRNFSPVWSPDGTYLVFSSTNPTAPGVYWIRSDGASSPQRLTEGRLAEWPASFSPDGKYVALTGEGANVEILIAQVIREPDHLRLGKLEPFQSSAFITASPKFSPDGKLIAYVSNETGVNEVYVSAVTNAGGARGGTWQISTAGGRYPIWSKSGRELFFQSADRQIMVLSYRMEGNSFIPGHARTWSEKHLLDLDTAYNYDLAPDGKR